MVVPLIDESAMAPRCMVAQKVVKTSAKSCERGVTLRGVQWRGVTLRGSQWRGVTLREPLAATEKGNLCSSSTLRVRFLFFLLRS